MKRLAAQFFATLVVVAVVLHYIWWITAAVGIIALTVSMLVLAFYLADRVDARAARLAALAALAANQHAWVLQGDERGVYGEYPAAPI
jgi:nitrate/nitrite transporter NarK